MKATNNRRARGMPAPAGPMVRMAGTSIVLFVLAAAAIGAGFYLRSHPEWTVRADIREYNGGVAAYDELLWAPLITSQESLLSVYPHVIEKAGGSFEKAGAASADPKFESVSLYNLGTMIGRVAFFTETLPGVDVSVAVTKLSEAIRNDPENEDAKFNKELLETKLKREEVEGAGPGLGYSPGVVDPGY